MKSPFTGGDTRLERELRYLEYRRDKFEVLYHFYVCMDTNERFTTTEIDILNLNQVYNKYREKYGIPFTDEIKVIREKYGLSAIKMSEVLGLGVNVYRNYESGEIPSVSTGRLIRLSQDPKEFIRLVEMSKNSFETNEFEKVKKKINHALSGWGTVEEMWTGWLLGNKYPNIFNGYRVPSLERIGNMVRFFAERNHPYTTALNKLLFYSDFGHFKKYGHGISGLCYVALPKGPVPENYGGVYNCLVNSQFVKVEEKDFGDFVGDIFFIDDTLAFDTDVGSFSETELKTLQYVSDKFKGHTTKKIVEISHKEPAWQDNVGDNNRISFEYGFELRNF